MAPWCSGYHRCTASFNKAWTQALRRFKSCTRRVGDSQCWGSLVMIPTGNRLNVFHWSTVPQKQFIIITTHSLRSLGLRGVTTNSGSCASQLSGKILHLCSGVLPKQISISQNSSLIDFNGLFKPSLNKTMHIVLGSLFFFYAQKRVPRLSSWKYPESWVGLLCLLPLVAILCFDSPI